jgi:hypothetical protein
VIIGLITELPTIPEQRTELFTNYVLDLTTARILETLCCFIPAMATIPLQNWNKPVRPIA